jgi:hypothetical protein
MMRRDLKRTKYPTNRTADPNVLHAESIGWTDRPRGLCVEARLNEHSGPTVDLCGYVKLRMSPDEARAMAEMLTAAAEALEEHGR